MGCPPVRKIIHSLKLVDYLHVQADNPWYNYYITYRPREERGLFYIFLFLNQKYFCTQKNRLNETTLLAYKTKVKNG